MPVLDNKKAKLIKELYELRQEIKEANKRKAEIEEKLGEFKVGTYKAGKFDMSVTQQDRTGWDNEKLNKYLGAKAKNFKKVTRVIKKNISKAA